MQKLIDLVKGQPPLPEPARWNLCREYLQVALLKSLFQAKEGRSLIFLGGTCLRICHGLRRYSEDLDFSWGSAGASSAFGKLCEGAVRDLRRQGFEVDHHVSADKVGQKAFVRFGGLPRQFGFTQPANQKLAVKIEADSRPPAHGVHKTFFVSRFGEVFPISKFDLTTLFAGKALAILTRPYDRGRDYYDLIWFLTQKIQGNMPYFQAGIEQVKTPSAASPAKTWEDVLQAIEAKVERVDTAGLVKDMESFLEDVSDMKWLKTLPEVYKQLRARPTNL